MALAYFYMNSFIVFVYVNRFFYIGAVGLWPVLTSVVIVAVIHKFRGSNIANCGKVEGGILYFFKRFPINGLFYSEGIKVGVGFLIILGQGSYKVIIAPIDNRFKV